MIRRIVDWGTGVADTIDYETALENTTDINYGQHLQMLEAAKRDPSLAIFYEDEKLMPAQILKQLKQSNSFWTIIRDRLLPEYKIASNREATVSNGEVELKEKFESIINLRVVSQGIPQQELLP